MKKIFALLLFICVILSLYSFIFLDGQNLSFEEVYISALTYVTDISTLFDSLTDVPNFIKNSVSSLTTKVTDFYTNIVKILADSFKSIWHNIKNGFDLSDDDDYMELGLCDICGGLSSECLCHLGDDIPPGPVT